MIHRFESIHLFACLAFVASTAVRVEARQLSVTDQRVDLDGLTYQPPYFLIPKATLLNGSGLGIYTPDEVGIVITGGQGGSWLDHFDATDRSLSTDFVYFNPTQDCSGPQELFGIGSCEFSISALIDPTQQSATAELRAYNFTQFTFPDASDDNPPPFATSSSTIDWDVLENDQLGSTTPFGVFLTVLEIDPANAPYQAVVVNLPAGHPGIRLVPDGGLPQPGTVRVRYRFSNACANSDAAVVTFIVQTTQGPIVNPDAFEFRVDEPIVIPIAALVQNDTVTQAAIDPASIVITGAQGGNPVPDLSDPAAGEVRFLLSFAVCDPVWFEYTIADTFGVPASGSARVDITILPPVPDCNANCLVDATEPDADGDGLPDDCELASGPCDVKRNAPGSVLLFPVFDNRATNVTLATITNTNPSILRAPNGLLAGTVDVEIVYIARFGPDGIDLPCLETNTTRRLTPNDSFTFWTRTDNPNAELGFFYAFAKDPTTGQAISWNHLVGETLLLSGFEDMEESYAALSFRSPLAQGTPTDLDGDGVRDLDGIEYDGAPNQILIPRFFGQDPPGTQGGHADRLVLVALSGGFEFETVVDVTIYNDNEVAFSAEHLFRCWDAPLLTEVSGGFLNQFLLDNENDAPDEGIGPADRQYGWIRLDGDRAFSTQDEVLDPAFYALLFERIGTRVVASPPFESCSQSNGDLFATGIFAER